MRRLIQPYNQPNIADGIAFSCSNDGKIQVSLDYIFKAIEKTVYPNQEYQREPDLKKWSNQGILLLNSALTTEIGKSGVHVNVWRPFMIFLFDLFYHYNPGIPYVFLGKRASEWKNHLGSAHHTLEATHPASAGYNNLQDWDSKDMFNWANSIIKNNNNQHIIW